MQGFEQLLSTILGIDPATLVQRLETVENDVSSLAGSVGLSGVADLIAKLEALEQKYAALAETVENIAKTAITVVDPALLQANPVVVQPVVNPPASAGAASISAPAVASQAGFLGTNS